jgi:hypothetical protein
MGKSVLALRLASLIAGMGLLVGCAGCGRTSRFGFVLTGRAGVTLAYRARPGAAGRWSDRCDA